MEGDKCKSVSTNHQRKDSTQPRKHGELNRTLDNQITYAFSGLFDRKVTKLTELATKDSSGKYICMINTPNCKKNIPLNINLLTT